MKTFPDLYAVRLKEPVTVVPGRPVCRWRNGAFAEAPRLADTFDPAQRDKFEAAGWHLVVPVTSTELTDELPEPLLIGRPLLTDDHSLAVDVGRMVVRLQPELSGAEAEATLQRHGLTIRRQLKFAPNLYEVDGPADSIAAEQAPVVTRDAAIIYAEPQVIEHIGPR